MREVTVRPEVAAFLAALQDAGRAALTIDKYRLSVGRYLAWRDGGELERRGGEGARLYLRQFSGVNTRRFHAGALRAWARYSGEVDVLGGVVKPPAPRTRPRVLLPHEDAALWAAAKRDPRPGPLLLVSLLRGSGLRLHEVVGVRRRMWDAYAGRLAWVVTDGLRIGEVDLERRGAVVRGKGGSVASVYLTEETVALIHAHLPMLRRREADAPLFQNAAGQALGTADGARMFERVVRDANLYARRVTPHMLRHTFATRFLESGGNLRAVQRLLRHQRLQSSLAYADFVDDAALRREFDVFNRLPDLGHLVGGTR